MCLELESIKEGSRALSSFPNAYGPDKKGHESEGERPAGIAGRETRGKGAGGKGVCYEFRDQGKCRHGDSCRFSHEVAEPAKNKTEEKAAKADKAAAAAAAAEQSTGSINTQAKGSGKGARAKGGGKGKDEGDPKETLCRSIRSGETCRFGDDCKFSHDVDAFNGNGTRRDNRSSQNQTPVANSASLKVKSSWMIASTAADKPAAKDIQALSELPEAWRTLTESDTGGYQYQTEVLILGHPV